MTRSPGSQYVEAPAVPHSGEYIPILDGWRGVAILLVLLFHGFYHTDVTRLPRLAAIAVVVGKLGALGVLIFFSISGYLITKKLLEETKSFGKFSVRAFYIKRIFRILPPVGVYLVVLAVLSMTGVITLARGDWAAPVFLSNYISGSWYTSHFWSLSVEEHFYLLWPLCLFLVGWRRAVGVGVFMIVAVGIWRPLVLRHVATQAEQARILQHTDMRLDYIMMGCVVALSVAAYPWLRRTLELLGSSVGFIALLTLLIVTTRVVRVDMRSVQALILTLLVCGSSMANAKLPTLLLANRFILFVGRISYSLYVWQQLFLAEQTKHWLQSAAMLPVKYACIVGAALLSFYLVERPAIKYGRNLLRYHRILRAGV